MSISDLEKLKSLLDSCKKGRSIITEINNKREFRNPENLQV